MMFVSGETAEPSVETTTLIEDIVRQQVIEIVSVYFAFDFTILAMLILGAALPKHSTSNPSGGPIYFD